MYVHTLKRILVLQIKNFADSFHMTEMLGTLDLIIHA